MTPVVGERLAQGGQGTPKEAATLATTAFSRGRICCVIHPPGRGNLGSLQASKGLGGDREHSGAVRWAPGSAV